MSAIVFRGKAQINSGFGTAVFDVIGYAEPQTFKLSQKWDQSIIKDRTGNDCSERAQNEKYEGDISFKLLGDTKTNAAKINSVTNGGFLPKLSNVAITGCDLAVANAVWVVQSGCDISMKNDDVADFSLKVQAYADPTQQALMVSIPS